MTTWAHPPNSDMFDLMLSQPAFVSSVWKRTAWGTLAALGTGIDLVPYVRACSPVHCDLCEESVGISPELLFRSPPSEEQSWWVTCFNHCIKVVVFGSLECPWMWHTVWKRLSKLGLLGVSLVVWACGKFLSMTEGSLALPLYGFAPPVLCVALPQGGHCLS